MSTSLLTADRQTIDNKADWLLIFESALRVGNFSSLDDLIHGALDIWLEQLAPELRWKIAIDLYTNDRISTGRAAHIAGQPYVVFMEKLRKQRIPFMAAESTTGVERAKEEALLDELFSFPSA